MTHEQALAGAKRQAVEFALRRWAEENARLAEERDALIRAASEAGININQISKLSGLSRTTIYGILG